MYFLFAYCFFSAIDMYSNFLYVCMLLLKIIATFGDSTPTSD